MAALALVQVGLYVGLYSAEPTGSTGGGGTPGAAPGAPALPSAAAWCSPAGITIFSGSLYVLTVTGLRWLGAITPIGGLSFIAGWLLLALAALARGRAVAP